MALKANRVGVRTDQVDEYGRVISSSFLQSLIDHLPRWTSLKVWKNGTEQLLPVNTDEPSTSPIVADIQYPTDSSVTEQMFTYRKSPTEVDGEAYIQSIKGNTIVWNQLISPNASSTGTSAGITYTFDGNGKITLSGTASGTATINATSIYPTYIVGHKYFLKGCPSGGSSSTYALRYNANGFCETGDGVILTATSSSQASGEIKVGTNFPVVAISNGYAISDSLVYIPQMFDLTVMGLDTKTLNEVKQWFADYYPLSYYSYDKGSLLSFNGTGIKTIGKNQLALPVVAYNTLYDLPLSGYFPILKGTYTLSYTANKSHRYIIKLVDANGNYLSDNAYKPNSTVYWSDVYQGWFLGADRPAGTLTFPVNIVENCYIRIGRSFTNPDTIELTNVQLEVGSTATSYEPYTTSTTTIPTDTYFPTGMKSAGTVYDEFTSSRAYTRIGEVDLGSLNWGYESNYYRMSHKAVSDMKIPTNEYIVPNLLSAKLTIVSSNAGWAGRGTLDLVLTVDSTGYIRVYTTSYTDAQTFKTAMDGVMLQYELAEEIIEPTLDFGE